MVDWIRFKDDGMRMLGRYYIYGAKADANNDTPVAFDCSGLVCYLYARRNVRLPDGSDELYRASLPVTDPRLGDLGFFKAKDKPCHHVGILFGDKVLEARGAPYGKVILRPRTAWENWKEFSGWYRPIALTQKERT